MGPENVILDLGSERRMVQQIEMISKYLEQPEVVIHKLGLTGELRRSV